MKTILVTGAAGFIGSHFVRSMIEKHPSWQFAAVDALTYAADRNFPGFIKEAGHEFINADITDAAAMADIFSRCEFDIIVNFAAQTHVDNSINTPDVFVHTNVYGTQCLLSAAKKAWQTGTDGEKRPVFKQGKLFLQVSTDEVYGDVKKGSAKETASLKPNSPYAASKASADLLVRSFIKTYGFPAIITRSTNNFGSHQFPEKLIPVMIRCALKDERLPVYGDGQQKRDWLYVLDHINALERVILSGKLGEVYNIGTGIRRTNLEIVRLILKELNKPERLITFVKDRPGHDRRYAVDTGKMAALGWKPVYDMESVLKDTIEWYKNK